MDDMPPDPTKLIQAWKAGGLIFAALMVGWFRRELAGAVSSIWKRHEERESRLEQQGDKHLERAFSATEVVIESLKEQLGQKAEELAMERQENATLVAKLEALQAKTETYRAECERDRAKLAATEERVKHLETRNDELESRYDSQNLMVNDMRREVADTRAVIDYLRAHNPQMFAGAPVPRTAT